MTWTEGRRVILRANAEEDWDRESGVLEGITAMPWGNSYTVRLDGEATAEDDRIREVTEEQLRVTRSLEECSRIWAARKLKLKLEQLRVGEVSFAVRSGCYHTDEEATIVVLVQVTGYSRAPRTRYREIEVREWGLSEFLEKLVAIAQEDDGARSVPA